MLKTIRDILLYWLSPVNRFLDYLTMPRQANGVSRFDRISFSFTLLFLAIAVLIYVFSPMVAFIWARQPFPGFLVEQSLVINSIQGSNWNGKDLGLNFPQQVTSINQHVIINPEEYQSFFATSQVNQEIKIHTRLPDGKTNTVTGLQLQAFPRLDLFRLFTIPYLVGFITLLMGIWVFTVRGKTRPGQAFAFASSVGSISIGLFFDLSTTHYWNLLWTITIAQMGSALISLALLFPEELKPVSQRIRFRLLTHGVSIGLATWGAITLFNQNDPWAYILPWRWSYIYSGFGLFFFIGMMAVRLQNPRNSLAYQQARIIGWGSLAAFTPLAAWFIWQLIVPTTFNPMLVVPPLLIFPLIVGFSILRYRLWDIDLIIRKTLVYAVLSAILVIFYVSSILLFQAALTGLGSQINHDLADSPLIIVLTTLIITAIFTPLRKKVQNTIDRNFYRNKYDSEKILEGFSKKLRQDINLEQVSNDLIKVVEETMQPEKISLWMKK